MCGEIITFSTCSVPPPPHSLPCLPTTASQPSQSSPAPISLAPFAPSLLGRSSTFPARTRRNTVLYNLTTTSISQPLEEGDNISIVISNVVVDPNTVHPRQSRRSLENRTDPATSRSAETLQHCHHRLAFYTTCISISLLTVPSVRHGSTLFHPHGRLNRRS